MTRPKPRPVAAAFARLKQNDVARRAGISESHLSLIVNGKRTPSLAVAKRLAKVLGLRIEAFL